MTLNFLMLMLLKVFAFQKKISERKNVSYYSVINLNLFLILIETAKSSNDC